MDVSTIVIDLAPYKTMALTILGGLAVIWGVRKLIGLLGR